MNKQSKWFENYTIAQNDRFVFENNLSVAVGTDQWHAKHTLHHSMLGAKTATEFINSVDESIASKMQFDLTALDKTRLYHYWCSRNVHGIDESAEEFNVAKEDVVALAQQHSIIVDEVTIDNAQYVQFTSMSLQSMQDFIDACKVLSDKLSTALTVSLTQNDSNMTWSCVALL